MVDMTFNCVKQTLQFDNPFPLGYERFNPFYSHQTTIVLTQTMDI